MTLKALLKKSGHVLHAARYALVGMALACAAASAYAPLDVRVALVIGNSAYDHVPALANPAHDAEAMSATLRLLGFNVVELRDGSRAQMLKALEDIRKALDGKQGVGVLYYAGHGVQLDLHNYMIPVDARLESASDVPKQALDLNQAVEMFKKAGNRMNIVVLDACRDNPFSDKLSSKGLAPMDAPTNTFLSYATAPGNVAEDGDPAVGNGLFTGYLVRELQRPATRIEDVFKRVRLQVRQQSSGRQIPWESTSLEDDFYFNDGDKHTFRPEDFQRMLGAAREREAQLQREAEQAREREKQQQALKALEALRAAEAQRLKELEEAQAAAREAARLRKLSEDQAREEAFHAEQMAWARIETSTNVDDFYAFLNRYPSGYISEAAQFRIDALQKARVQAQALPEAPKQLPAGAPRHAVGDVDVYDLIDKFTRNSERRKFTVTAIKGDTVEINDGGIIQTQSGMVLRDKHAERTYSPGILRVPADLELGKRWKTAFEATNADGSKDSGYWNYKVAALEDVTVPAGTFRAYRIEGSGFNNRGGGGVLQMTSTLWIDPATMKIVRDDELRRNPRMEIKRWDSMVLVKRVLAPRTDSVAP